MYPHVKNVQILMTGIVLRKKNSKYSGLNFYLFISINILTSGGLEIRRFQYQNNKAEIHVSYDYISTWLSRFYTMQLLFLVPFLETLMYTFILKIYYIKYMALIPVKNNFEFSVIVIFVLTYINYAYLLII